MGIICDNGDEDEGEVVLEDDGGQFDDEISDNYGSGPATSGE
jgi:hypothetical protein